MQTSKQTNTANEPVPVSRQVRRQMERRREKNMRRHQNEVVMGRNRKR